MIKIIYFENTWYTCTVEVLDDLVKIKSIKKNLHIKYDDITSITKYLDCTHIKTTNDKYLLKIGDEHFEIAKMVQKDMKCIIPS